MHSVNTRTISKIGIPYLVYESLEGVPENVPHGFRKFLVGIGNRHPEKAVPWLNGTP
jgi:hypothetical protein